MNAETAEILDEAIQIESNLSALYLIFKKAIAEDAHFWSKMSMEANNQAVMIRSAKEALKEIDFTPGEIKAQDRERIKEVHRKIRALIDEFTDKVPARRTACFLAMEIEFSAGELDFNAIINADSSSEAAEIIEKAFFKDSDHPQRLRAFMTDNNILTQG